MAADQLQAVEHAAPSGKQGLGRALRDIIIALVVLGGLFAAYYWKIETNKVVADLAKLAREAALKDSLKGYQKARTLLAEALQKPFADPYVVSLMAEVSVVLAYEYDQADAKADFASWLEKSEKEDAHIQERYSAMTLHLLGQGKAQEANGYILPVIEKGAAGGKMVNALGRSQRKLGQWIEARTAFKRAMDTEWRSPRFATDNGDYLFIDADLYNATAAYEKAIQQNPEHIRALIGKARTLILRGDRISEADEALNDVLARGDDEVVPKMRSLALVARGEMAKSGGYPDQALQLADKAIELDANNAFAHHLKGLLLAEKKDPGALAELQKAVELDLYVPAFYFDAALALMKGGQPEPAVEQMKAYEKALPLDERYHLKYGDLLKAKGDLIAAMAQYDEALKIDEFNAVGHYSKGIVLMEQKLFGDAETELGYALAARANYPDAIRAMGDLWWERKQIDKALEQYAQALVKGKMVKQPQEKLDAFLAEVLEKLRKAGHKEYAAGFEKEILPLLK